MHGIKDHEVITLSNDDKIIIFDEIEDSKSKRSEDLNENDIKEIMSSRSEDIKETPQSNSEKKNI